MMVFRNASKLRQPLAKEAMSVLAAVYVNVADHVRIIVRDRQMSVNAVVLVDVILDRVVVGAENHRLVAFLGNLFVYVLEILSTRNSTRPSERRTSVTTGGLSDSKLPRPFLSPRKRGLSSSFSMPFSPAVS